MGEACTGGPGRPRPHTHVKICWGRQSKHSWDFDHLVGYSIKEAEPLLGVFVFMVAALVLYPLSGVCVWLAWSGWLPARSVWQHLCFAAPVSSHLLAFSNHLIVDDCSIHVYTYTYSGLHLLRKVSQSDAIAYTTTLYTFFQIREVHFNTSPILQQDTLLRKRSYLISVRLKVIIDSIWVIGEAPYIIWLPGKVFVKIAAMYCHCKTHFIVYFRKLNNAVSTLGSKFMRSYLWCWCLIWVFGSELL